MKLRDGGIATEAEEQIEKKPSRNLKTLEPKVTAAAATGFVRPLLML